MRGRWGVGGGGPLDGSGEEGQGFGGSALAQQDGGGIVAAARLEEAAGARGQAMLTGRRGEKGRGEQGRAWPDAAPGWSPEEIEWRRHRAGLRQCNALAVAPDGAVRVVGVGSLVEELLRLGKDSVVFLGILADYPDCG